MSNHYQGRTFEHGQKFRVGVLISNLGTPDAPTPKALKRYLKQFLSDPRVVEVPRLLWWLILNLVILNIRPRRSAKAYQSVWTDDGSPLAIYTAAQADALKNMLQSKYGDDVIIEWGMRYGNPSIDSALDKLINQGADKLLVLPLYPQYSGSTTASTFDAVAHNFTTRRWLPELRFINGYHQDSGYIDALCRSIKDHINEHGKPDKLIFSYHGVPKRYLANGDPYHCYCLQTTRLVTERLGMKEAEFENCFQSRFGREPWLQPYTDETLKSLAQNGTKSVAVICPGFSSDCLETIEEIDEENRGYFLDAGGEHFHYIPALNASTPHIDYLAELIENHIKDWLTSGQNSNPDAMLSSYEAWPHNK
jgi:ferrochelatase